MKINHQKVNSNNFKKSLKIKKNIKNNLKKLKTPTQNM